MWHATEQVITAKHLERIDRPWRSMPEEVREAILNLLAEPYVRMAYPTEADFAAAFGAVVGTPTYREAWARQLAERRAVQRAGQLHVAERSASQSLTRHETRLRGAISVANTQRRRAIVCRRAKRAVRGRWWCGRRLAPYRPRWSPPPTCNCPVCWCSVKVAR